MSALEVGDGSERDDAAARDVPAIARLRSPLSEPRDVYVPLRGFKLESGSLLSDPHVRVRRHGRRNGPPIVVMGGISSGRKLYGADGWWNDIVAPNAAVDLNESCAYGIDFAPVVDERVALSPLTQARLLIRALDELGIHRLQAIIGASYGGMVGMAFAALAPERASGLCIISAAHRPSPLASAWRGVARRIVEFGLDQGRGSDAMALARQLSMITYRSEAEFSDRFHRLLGSDGQSDLDHYLVARGNAYRDAMSPRRWLSLSESIDRFSIAPESVRVPTTLVACPTDQIAPMAEMTELARRLPRLVALHALPSLYGHDAFLKEPERLGGIIRSFLRTTNS